MTVSVYPRIAATNDATVLPQGALDLLDGEIQTIKVTSADKRFKTTLSGPEGGWPGIQDCIIMSGGLQGLTPGFKHIDLKGARQPGVTWTGTIYDTCNLTMSLQAHANSARGISRLMSEWVAAWNPVTQAKFEYFTLDRGYWWFPARWSEPWNDPMKQLPRLVKYYAFTQKIRNDLAFWLGIPSYDTFPRSTTTWTGTGSGWFQFQNIGDQDGWPSILCYAGTHDGATFSFANGVGSTSMMTFGPLKAGQVVLLSTLPRVTRVVDLTPPGAVQKQNLTASQQMIADLTNWVSGTNIPPALVQYESQYGILPPQGPLEQLYTGNYSTPIPGVGQPNWAQTQNLACAISGGNNASKMVAAITPMRVWPE